LWYEAFYMLLAVGLDADGSASKPTAGNT